MLLDPALTLTYLAVAIVLTLAPGPDVLFVLANGLQYQTKGAVAATLGICTGTLLHSVAAAIGISAMIAASPIAFEILRYGGALYLVYLGVKSIYAFLYHAKIRLHKPIGKANPFAVFKQGLLTNLLNPKVIIFYLALLPQFVNPQLGHVGWQIFLLGCLHTAMGLIYLVVIGTIAGRASKALIQSQFRRWLDAIAGLIFIALALRLALVD